MTRFESLFLAEVTGNGQARAEELLAEGVPNALVWLARIRTGATTKREAVRRIRRNNTARKAGGARARALESLLTMRGVTLIAR